MAGVVPLCYYVQGVNALPGSSAVLSLGQGERQLQPLTWPHHDTWHMHGICEYLPTHAARTGSAHKTQPHYAQGESRWADSPTYCCL